MDVERHICARLADGAADTANKNTSLPTEPAEPDCESASDGRHDRARARAGGADAGGERSRSRTQQSPNYS